MAMKLSVAAIAPKITKVACAPERLCDASGHVEISQPKSGAPIAGPSILPTDSIVTAMPFTEPSNCAIGGQASNGKARRVP